MEADAEAAMATNPANMVKQPCFQPSNCNWLAVIGLRTGERDISRYEVMESSRQEGRQVRTQWSSTAMIRVLLCPPTDGRTKGA